MFTDLNELMSSRLVDVTIQVGAYFMYSFGALSLYTVH